jgi:hypothetical protein
MRLSSEITPDFAGAPRGSAQCRFDKFRWTVFVFCALWALSAPCLASETPTSSASQPVAAAALWEQGGAIADLDGDGLPDLAIARAEGWGPKGFQYRIGLDLTTRAGPTSFSVSAEIGGLRIIPRDVDGDGYLDLVITSAWSLAPVGVWINDGHGRFTQGDPTTQLRSIWTEGPGITSNTPHETFQATVSQTYRSWIDFSVQAYFRNELPFNRLPLLLTAASPQRVVASETQTRAPPPIIHN